MCTALPSRRSSIRPFEDFHGETGMRKYLIIGCGVAGINAADAIRSCDPSAGITIISDDPHGFYSRPGLAYFLTGELPQKQLYIYTKTDWRQLNAHFIHGQATRLVPKEHRLLINHSELVNYDRLLVATGASAVRLDLPGAELQGVVYLDNLEDTRHIIKRARMTRTAVVVGGGILALELVEGLKARGIKVHYLLRGSRYWPNVLDETESSLVQERLIDDGVIIHPRAEITTILGKKNRVVAVHTSEGEQIPAGMVAVCIGVRPNIDLARVAGLETEKGIIVNNYLQTDQEDIFAAGDAAQVYDRETGQKTLDLLWHPARLQGYAAGVNMTGKTTRFQRSIAVNVLRLAGVMTSIIGAVGGRGEEEISILRGSSETWRQLPNTIAVASGGGVNQVRLLVGDTTLEGAVVMGEQTLSKPLQDLISEKINISTIRPRLLDGNPNLGQILMDFWITIKR
jgi:NAD(P)H-nitrite reductase large subunit